MRIIVGCEFSQIVTKAFREKGHEAYSCDLLPTEGNLDWHFREDIFSVLENNQFDMGIFHPPCTYLSNAGIGWFNEARYGEKAIKRKELRLKAFDFVMALFNSDIPKIAMENPVGWINSHFRKPDQIIQPYHFGDAESKRTCLWLKNLPLLTPTKIVSPQIYAYYKRGKKKGQPIYGVSYCKFGKDRWKIRSKTFQGIANAMANQWNFS